MTATLLSNWGPEFTPAPLRRLITITLFISILSASVQTVFEQFGFTPGPQEFLSLSRYGLRQGFLWQPFTFLFLQDTTYYGLSLYFFINLAFTAYILWILGAAIIGLTGIRPFLRFYFACGIGAALITLFIEPIWGGHINITGNTTALLALLTVWSMAYAEGEIYLFLLIPVKAKWLALGVFGALTLISLTHLDFTSFVLYFASALFGYTYATTAWGLKSPYPQMERLDDFMISLGTKVRRKTPSWAKNNKNSDTVKSKIIDIQSGQPLKEDDDFVDAMLAKISKYGEKSLSWQEKKRLQQISEKKKESKP